MRIKADRWTKPIGLILGPKVGSHLALFCIHQMNRVNSCNGSAMTTAP